MSFSVFQANLPFQSVFNFLRLLGPESAQPAEDWASTETEGVTIGDILFVLELVPGPKGNPSKGLGISEGDQFKASDMVMVFRQDAGYPMGFIISSDKYEMQFVETVLTAQSDAARKGGKGYYYLIARPKVPLTGTQLAELAEMHKWGNSGSRSDAPRGLGDPAYAFLSHIGASVDAAAASSRTLPIDALAYSVFAEEEYSASWGLPDSRSVIAGVRKDGALAAEHQAGIIAGSAKVPDNDSTIDSARIGAPAAKPQGRSNVGLSALFSDWKDPPPVKAPTPVQPASSAPGAKGTIPAPISVPSVPGASETTAPANRISAETSRPAAKPSASSGLGALFPDWSELEAATVPEPAPPPTPPPVPRNTGETKTGLSSIFSDWKEPDTETSSAPEAATPAVEEKEETSPISWTTAPPPAMVPPLPPTIVEKLKIGQSPSPAAPVEPIKLFSDIVGDATPQEDNTADIQTGLMFSDWEEPTGLLAGAEPEAPNAEWHAMSNPEVMADGGIPAEALGQMAAAIEEVAAGVVTETAESVPAGDTTGGEHAPSELVEEGAPAGSFASTMETVSFVDDGAFLTVVTEPTEAEAGAETPHVEPVIEPETEHGYQSEIASPTIDATSGDASSESVPEGEEPSDIIKSLTAPTTLSLDALLSEMSAAGELSLTAEDPADAWLSPDQQITEEPADGDQPPMEVSADTEPAASTNEPAFSEEVVSASGEGELANQIEPLDDASDAIPEMPATVVDTAGSEPSAETAAAAETSIPQAPSASADQASSLSIDLSTMQVYVPEIQIELFSESDHRGPRTPYAVVPSPTMPGALTAGLLDLKLSSGLVPGVSGGLIAKLEQQAQRAGVRMEEKLIEIQERLLKDRVFNLRKVQIKEEASDRNISALKAVLFRKISFASDEVKEEVRNCAEQGRGNLLRFAEVSSQGIVQERDSVLSQVHIAPEQIVPLSIQGEPLLVHMERAREDGNLKMKAELQVHLDQMEELEKSHLEVIHTRLGELKVRVEASKSTVRSEYQASRDRFISELTALRKFVLDKLDSLVGELYHRLVQTGTSVELNLSMECDRLCSELILARIASAKQSLPALMLSLREQLRQELDKDAETRLAELAPLLTRSKEEIDAMSLEADGITNAAGEAEKLELETLLAQLQAFFHEKTEEFKALSLLTKEELENIDGEIGALSNPSSIESEPEIAETRVAVLQRLQKIGNDLNDHVNESLRGQIANMEDRARVLQEDLISSMEADAYSVRKTADSSIARLREKAESIRTRIKETQDLYIS